MRLKKSVQREENDPLRPLDRIGVDHAIEDQQHAESRVRERCDERGGVDQILQRLLLEEVALQMKDHSCHADDERRPPDDEADRPPEARR